MEFYVFNIRKNRKEKLDPNTLEVGIMKIVGKEKDTSRYFVRGKISDGSTRYVFINESKYKTLKSMPGVKNAGTVVKHRKEKRSRKKKSKSKSSSKGSRKKKGSGERRRRSKRKGSKRRSRS